MGVGKRNLFLVCTTRQPGTESIFLSAVSKSLQHLKTSVMRARSLSCAASPP